MISRFGEYIPLAVLITLVFIFGNFILTYKNIELLKTQQSLNHSSNTTLTEIDSTLTNLTNAESKQRGYLITQDDTFLNEFQALKKALDENYQRLDELTNDDPRKNSFAKQIRKKANERVLTLQKGIGIRNELGYDAAYEFILSGDGARQMGEARKLILQFSELEKKAEQARDDESDRIFDTLFLGVTIGNLLSFLFVLLSYFLIKRELDQRIKQEKGKDEFINMASHELKTPITSLKVYLQVVLRKLDEKNIPEAKRYIEKIDEQTNKLTNLVIDLLDMSRIQTGKMKIEKEPLNLDALIIDTAEALQGTTRKHKIIANGELKRMVLADRYRIYQVLVNLLTNAIKYSPKGGRIVIKTRAVKGMAQVSVKDQGIGIEGKYQRKIFERLYQVTDRQEKTFPGLGIGLYISNQIVKRHGGRMWVISKKNGGSTFYFDLPFQD